MKVKMKNLKGWKLYKTEGNKKNCAVLITKRRISVKIQGL